MKRKLIGKWHAAAFLVFCFVFALTASGVFYNQRGKLAGEYGNMVASNLTSYTQAQKRYLNSSITDAWNTLKGISGLVEQIVPEYTQDSLNGYLDQLNLQNRDYMIEYVTLQELERRLRSSRRRNVTGACLVSLSREQVWCPIYGTGRRPGTSRCSRSRNRSGRMGM